MSERPYVTLSCAMSIDGYLDSLEPARLAMSNAADLDRVDDVRALHDAIMVGASTVRRDNPRLLVRDAARRARRLAAGRQESPAKVTVTASGELSPDAAFFTTGRGPASSTARGIARRISAPGSAIARSWSGSAMTASRWTPCSTTSARITACGVSWSKAAGRC